jgi:hypothetical protein
MPTSEEFMRLAEEAARSAVAAKSEAEKNALIEVARTYMQAALKADKDQTEAA